MTRFFLILFFVGISFSGISQIELNETQPLPETADSTSIIEIDPMADEKNALYSAVVPGLGQVRNKQYVKAGVILGSFTYGLLTTIDKSKDFKELDDQYSTLLRNYDSDINTVDELNTLWDARQNKRNTKDMWTAATTYVYVGNLIDAAAQYKILREEKKEHSATKAAYYSAILPGLGQVYNKKYWKVPLVYAALGGSLYVARQNRNYHRDYLRELEYDQVGETTGFRSQLQEAKLKESVDYWRKWRDAAYIATGVVYALNIIDATVDAHLYDFNVDDELVFEASPVFNTLNGEPYYAVQIGLPINSKKK